MMRSLVILSLPRSLSSHVHDLCCTALGLRGPAWTSAGEMMNVDRSVLFMGADHAAAKFTTPGDRERFAPAREFLSHVFQPEGFCYKDVVQPFVVTEWLAAHPDVPVLKIAPNLAHVATAMMARQWLYPIVAAPDGSDLGTRMLAGLMRAADAIARVPGETVAYDDLIADFEPLWHALGRLYPDADIKRTTMAPDFAPYRDAVLLRRSGEPYGGLARLQQAMRAPVAGPA